MKDTKESDRGNRETLYTFQFPITNCRFLIANRKLVPSASSGQALSEVEGSKIDNVFILLGLIIAIAWSSSTYAQIAIDGRYWKYNGRRVLLLGGWNHGHNPFIDHDTDNDKDSKGVSSVEQIKDAMDELASAGGNYLRCALDPGMAAGTQGFDFCAKSGAQYDLNTMTGPFWTRIEMFIAEASKRNIIVQIEVWDRFDLIDGSWGSWPVSPWNPKNNVNYTMASSGLAESYGSFGEHPFIQGVPGHSRVNIGTGDWGPATTISGPSTVTIARPDDSSHWVATIVR